jgi:hypothetical protein
MESFYKNVLNFVKSEVLTTVNILVFWVVIALMMEAASPSDTSVNFYQTTRRYNPEDSHLHVMIYLNSDNFAERFPLRFLPRRYPSPASQQFF